MRTLLIYSIYLSTSVAVLFLVRRLERTGGLARIRAWQTVCAASAFGLTIFAISEPRHRFEDFVDAYYAGGAIVLGGGGVDQRFARGVNGFVNLPILAYAFVPFAVLPPAVAAGIFTALGVLAVVYTWRLLVKELCLDRYRAALLLALFLANGPLMNSIREGNTSHFALLAVTLALLELRRSRDLWAGFLIGVAGLFKLPLLVFGAYFVVRRRFRAAAGGALAIGSAALLSVLVFGLDAHLTWYRQFIASAGENPLAAFNVQSFSALMARLERGGGLCDWNGHPLSRLGRSVASGSALLLYAVSLIAAIRPRGSATRSAPSRAELELEFLVVLMLACTTSPLAWSHYYALCLLPVAFMLEPGSRVLDTPATRALGCLAIFGVSLLVVRPVCEGLGIFAVPYSLLVSHYLFAGIAILLLLLRERRRRGAVGSQLSGNHPE